MIKIGQIKDIIFKRGESRDVELYVTHRLRKEGFFSSRLLREELDVLYKIKIGTSDIVSKIINSSFEIRIISKRTETPNAVLIDTEELDEMGRVVPGGDYIIVFEQHPEFGLITYLKIMGMKQKMFQVTDYKYVS